MEFGKKGFKSSDAKLVAKAVLKTLAVFHAEGIVHTDVKPDNILVNCGSNGQRFSDIKLADCAASRHIDTVDESQVIGATIFRSPEAMFNLVWGTATDIWSLGATLISLIYGDHWHIFKPVGVSAEDSTYSIEVFRRHNQFFGPFPLSYESLLDDDRLGMLTDIISIADKYTLFRRASSTEISNSDRDFICTMMHLDPRDRPSAEELLQDQWFREHSLPYSESHPEKDTL
ncbi:MAG: hypothetical protein HETSPECPRED_004378 [Heterodermia speciosa]|uniref:Protein kinase domain-containing protein n=1 Tax=Heterodermia speciosa TaxID=116794 RepID=A0A8H3FF94_9LECA|nr:MAG: hypothetical protein HETSPECPRED_004378 [Heterodermia speciosa]